MPGEVSAEERKRPGVAREYRTDQIVVYWEPGLCIHTGRCIQGLPQVFDPQGRPWIKVEAASAEEIAEVIMRCPTGALTFWRLDDGEQETPQEVTQIRATPNGPLYVRGKIRLIAQDGQVHELPRIALCRCGFSANKPFCDGSHTRAGFRSE